ncbi:MAG: restriction endonuclease subunit S [Methylococcales bacterium]|nr:restriction endonuclease subunit S [Methylococcaceae bacterium]
MNKHNGNVGRVSASVTRQAPDASVTENVGLRCANPTYGAEFQKTNLGQLITFANGKSCPERFDNAKFAVFGANGLIGKANESNSPSNSIVVGRVGTYCGAVHFSRQACWVTDNAIKATVKEDNDPSYLFYLLKHLNLNNWRSGSGQPLINQSTLNAIEVRVPLPIEQKSIGSFVGALDDRITLLRETNATLEAIAQALFKSWFVDFDPVHAKQQGREPEGMDEATAALFPDSFEESELGLLPRGWMVSNCQKVIDVRDGTHESPKPAFSGYPLITSRHITGGKICFDDTYLIADQDYENISKRSKVHRFDVLITMIGTVGIPVIVLDEQTEFAIKNIGLFKTSATPFLSHYLYLLLSSSKMQQYLEARLAGTTQKYLSLKALREISLLIPPDSVMAVFSEIISPVFEKIHQNNCEAQTLANLRDTLLPRLISGQLRLPEAEILIKETQ